MTIALPTSYLVFKTMFLIILQQCISLLSKLILDTHFCSQPIFNTKFCLHFMFPNLKDFKNFCFKNQFTAYGSFSILFFSAFSFHFRFRFRSFFDGKFVVVVAAVDLFNLLSPLYRFYWTPTLPPSLKPSTKTR